MTLLAMGIPRWAGWTLASPVSHSHGMEVLMLKRSTMIAGVFAIAATATASAQDVDRQSPREFYEGRIAAEKGEIEKYRGIIAQQRRAAAISGFVDKQTMYLAGLQIDR